MAQVVEKFGLASTRLPSRAIWTSAKACRSQPPACASVHQNCASLQAAAGIALFLFIGQFIGQNHAMKINQNTILITGGGSGIGMALAKAFVAAGNEVIICGRNLAKLEAACQAVPALQRLQCDISDEASIRRMLDEHSALMERVTILVNNAAIMNVMKIHEPQAKLADMEAEINTNLTGTLRMSKLMLPSLMRQPEAALVIISSGVAYLPVTSTPVYCATKAALHSLAQSMRYQLRNTSVKVFEILPPVVATDMPAQLEGTGKDMKGMSPDEFAARALRGIERDQYELPVGDARLLYWASRFVPSLVTRRLQAM